MRDLRTAHPAFVLSLFDTGLAVVRDLAAAGIAVTGFDSDRAQPGFSSRCCRAVVCPKPERDQELVDLLIKEAARHAEKPVIFPASDVFVSFLARNDAQLRRRFLFNIPNPDLVDTFVSKATQYEFVERTGVVAPRSLRVSNRDELALAARELQFPVFLKPALGNRWQEHFYSKGLRVETSGEMTVQWNRVHALGLDMVAQEIVPGPASGNFEVSAYVSSRGEISAPFIMQKDRQFPVDFGAGTMGRSVVYPELAMMMRKFLAKLRISGFSGFANTEFKWDERDGKFKYIETNLRVWQQIALATKCGLNFPLMQYRDLTNQPALEHIGAYRADVGWMDPVRDGYSGIESRMQGRLNLRAWLGSLSGVRVFGIFSWRDPWPALKTVVLTRQIPALLFAASKMFMGRGAPRIVREVRPMPRVAQGLVAHRERELVG